MCAQNYICSSRVSGGILQDIFVQWLRHFIYDSKPTKEDTVLLILDGYFFPHEKHPSNKRWARKQSNHRISATTFYTQNAAT